MVKKTEALPSAMASGASRSIIIIDDNDLPELKALIEKAGWTVVVTSNWEKVIDGVRGKPMDAPQLISIDLGLPPKPDDVDVGLEVLQRLREIDDGQALVVHSVQRPSERIVREVFAARASFIKIHTSSQKRAFVAFLPLLAEGYLACCGTAKFALQACVRPNNPLQPGEWELLGRLARREKYESIARALGTHWQTVQNRVKDIATRLEERGLIDLNHRIHATAGHVYIEPLVKFFVENAERYGVSR